MGYHAADAIDEAIDATRSRLFPLSGWLWARIAFVTLFLGGAGGVPTQLLNVPTTPTVPTPDASGASGGIDPGVGIGAIAAVGLVVGLLVVVFSIAAATMQFVFVDALTEPDRASVRVIGPFFDRLGAGVRLFGFQLAVGLLAAVPILLLGGAVFATTGTDSLGLFAVAGVVAVVVVVIAGLVRSLTVQFVVPVMIQTGGTVTDAWRTLWPSLRSQLSESVVYVVVRVLLGLGVSILNGLGTAVLLLPVALIAVIVGAVFGGLTTVAVGSDAGTLVGLVSGGFVGVVGAVIVGLAVSVATKTYLRTYELASLAGFDDRFQLLPDETEQSST